MSRGDAGPTERAQFTIPRGLQSRDRGSVTCQDNVCILIFGLLKNYTHVELGLLCAPFQCEIKHTMWLDLFFFSPNPKTIPTEEVYTTGSWKYKGQTLSDVFTEYYGLGE